MVSLRIESKSKDAGNMLEWIVFMWSGACCTLDIVNGSKLGNWAGLEKDFIFNKL